MTMIDRDGGVKRPLIIIALTILAVVAGAILLRPDPAGTENGTGENRISNSDEASFDVKLIKPWSSRPLGGLFGLIPAEDLRFDHKSPEAEAVQVKLDGLELKATDWQLVLKTDGEKIAPSSFLIVRMELGGEIKTLRCRPADPVVGNLKITTADGTEYLSGKFHLELPTCERAETGRKANWPPAPLTLRGSFNRLPITAGFSERGC